ncbi:MAG: hypothetical protein P857_273 [Candidatus Xenolissoclinum pacificiensis L6]|uniref:2-C-methyl-D-erythritol 4-phosphate cytidylyltransferase n=1 Tax=Candidatus Xenolissoclinum pacificiensis L6 TaxID=1401685 RepID=W2V135_9RICK|nr:MAG: hypothetical protein P857_273 [Candidatus Xenolissoclinum pacificiensis L6]
MIYAILLAAGRGNRCTGCASIFPKQYHTFQDGSSFLVVLVQKFLSLRIFPCIVIHPDDVSFFTYTLGTLFNRVLVTTTCGHNRQDSVYSGVLALSNLNPKYVIVHDVARPSVSVDLIMSVVQGLYDGASGVVPVIDITDTVASVNEGKIGSILNRDIVKRLTTPQGFLYQCLRECHEKIRLEHEVYSDDISILFKFNHDILTIPGEVSNGKVTDIYDLLCIQTVGML